MDKAAGDALPDEIAEIVTFHSRGAAVAALAVTWIPGLGGLRPQPLLALFGRCMGGLAQK
jgi:hypothetical protein